MMKQLRKKLTLLYTLTTGCILTAVVIGTLIVSTGQLEKKNLENFQNYLLTINSRMQFGSTIDVSWLSRMEAEGHLLIHIEENRTPFLYTGSWQPETKRHVLIERAKQQALGESVSTDTRPVSASTVRSSVFTVKGDYSDSYYASILVLPTTKGYQSLTLLGYQIPPSESLHTQRILFLLFDILGILALGVVSWFFVGRSLKPIEVSHRRQTEFIAAASHELRSPLAVIQSSITAIPDDPGEQAHYLKNMDRECSRMSRLIHDMLLLASTDAGNWSLHLESVDVDTLLIGTYELFEPVYADKHQHLNLELPEDPLPHINGDCQRLEQVLTILLDNASSYTPEGKNVTLRSYAKNHTLSIEVSDEGCGIPAEAKKQIFDRFYKGDSARTDKQHFGLGLSIAWELVRLHKGQIRAEDSPSGGTSFVISLPY